MKYSTHFKSQGHKVILNPLNASHVDKVYCSVIFTKNQGKALRLNDIFPDIEFGGTGISLEKTLPLEIEMLRPDYDLYTAKDIYNRMGGIMTTEKKLEKASVIVNAGIGFTSRGCVRKCDFCVVPAKEGDLYKVSEIKDIINPRSNVIILLDNNFTADTDCIDKLKEIKERNLIVDITQGIDVRTMTPEIAKALSEVKHLRSIHYAWDYPHHENSIMNGIKILSDHIKRYRHLCFTLVGYNTSFEEDYHRFAKLVENGVDPYIMVFNQTKDARLNHFARWVNGRIYKACKSFDNYEPWIKVKNEYLAQGQMNLFAH